MVESLLASPAIQIGALALCGAMLIIFSRVVQIFAGEMKANRSERIEQCNQHLKHAANTTITLNQLCAGQELVLDGLKEVVVHMKQKNGH